MRDQNMQKVDRSVHCRIHTIASASCAMTGTRLHSAGSIGIGIIGTGEITRIMRPAFSGSTEARVVAVADVNIDAARAEAEALGGAEVFADYRARSIEAWRRAICLTTEHADKLETKEVTP